MSQLKLIATGTGAAFTMGTAAPYIPGSPRIMGNAQTNYVISTTDDDGNVNNMLVDCGNDIRWSLRFQGFNYMDIGALYVSHAHGDHAAGIDYIAFPSYFDPRYKVRHGRKPLLFAERQLMRDLWDHSWRGSLESLEGIDAVLDTFFETRPINKNGSFEFGGIKFDIVQSIHISAKYSIVDSFGLMFTDFNGKRVYITTDVQFAPETSMKAYYKEADIIIHDCETMYKSGVHAHYDLLRTLPSEIKTKMRLSHYQDNVLDDWDAWQERAKADGFYGFVKDGVIYSTDE
jgi:ribonuclease BN (tRNA processing enzyme)